MAQLKSLFYEAAQAGVLRRPLVSDEGVVARLLAEHHEHKPAEVRDAVFASSIRLIATIAGLPEPGRPEPTA